MAKNINASIKLSLNPCRGMHNKDLFLGKCSNVQKPSPGRLFPTGEKQQPPPPGPVSLPRLSPGRLFPTGETQRPPPPGPVSLLWLSPGRLLPTGETQWPPPLGSVSLPRLPPGSLPPTGETQHTLYLAFLPCTWNNTWCYQYSPVLFFTR